ncbi:hypothetical protein IFM89_007033 [Coptis chinensis]|uniref:Endonuclease/exonuclease/phosphatase domain-containing protein n=1 Tax=Coptis chinensis TaxID=261450 RepID=A0A835IMU5_9MAGN|nr:hypothetical protein IFM89_007033 [Coptis chinensis]
MRCIFWNVRGISNDETKSRLAKLVKKWEPDIIGIAEPKIDPSSFSTSYLRSLGLYTQIVHNSNDNMVPNLWLLWKNDLLAPTLHSQSSQHITVESPNGLITIIHSSSVPTEKEGGRTPLSVAMSDFRDMVSSNQLMEAPHSRFEFTWWNKQMGVDKVVRKLDRAFVNNEWNLLHPGWRYRALSKLCSDHSPLVG